MIYYKLTCIKDIPGLDAGFSHTFSKENLDYPGCICFSNDPQEDEKINKLRRYMNYPDFIKTEPDLSYAVEELVCPKCGKMSLFTFKDNEDEKYTDGDVTRYYKGTGLICAFCNWKKYLSSVCTKTHVSW